MSTSKRDLLANNYGGGPNCVGDVYYVAEEAFKAGWDARDKEIKELKRMMNAAVVVGEDFKSSFQKARERIDHLTALLQRAEESLVRVLEIKALQGVQLYNYSGAIVNAKETVEEIRKARE